MECFLTELGKTLTEKVLNKAIEKSRNIFCFTCIVKEFNEEKDKLEARRVTMREKFQVATYKGKGIKDDARFWEEHANMLIQENTETNQRCFLGFCPDCIWKYKRGEVLLTKTKEITKLMEEKFENVELDRPLPGVECYSSQCYISFESRDLKYNELLDALRDDSNYITRLQGMGGTGKTTLAKQVGRKLKKLGQFNHVIYTEVSFNPDIKKIQDNIAGHLGLKWEEDIYGSDRPKRLECRLTNGEKILLILDDVWGNLNFNDIGIPNSDNRKGCKVLVTTCNMRVCNQMVCKKIIQLELLNDEEAWIMFKLHANLTDISSKSILKKGREIATECKRLPLAIAYVASSLRGLTLYEEWDLSLVDVYNVLKFSYDFLQDKEAEGLFHLCSIFPEDAEISTEDLTRLGIGVGLFGEDYAMYEDARWQAVEAKNKLLDSYLLLETEKGDVKMNGLARGLALWIAKNEINIVNFSNKNQKSKVERDKNIKYLTCEGNLRDLFASKFDGSKLEILIGKMHMEDIVHIPISFFENIPRLRVLNLSSHGSFRHPLSFPQSIKSLLNIRSLSFKKVDLGDISAFGGLRYIETLELTHCAIDELPCEIGKLRNFRWLKLEKCVIRNKNPFEVIQRCQSLEELYFLNSFNDFWKEITLPTLQRYYLSDYYSMMKEISRGVSLKWDYLSEATLKYVMEKTEHLRLEGTDKGWRNLMPGIVPIDNGMNDLIQLYLQNCHQVQCLVDTKHINYEVPNVFSKLVVLHLEEMENLEGLVNGPISLDSFFNLEELYIKGCQKLRSLFHRSVNLSNLKNITLESCSKLVSVFDMTNSQSLPLLKSLKISKCEQLENIIENKPATVFDMTKSCCSMFPNLKVLDIHMCPQLQFILPFLSADDFLLLESIRIASCDKLKYIFGQHQDVKLPSLEETLISDMPNFIDIFPESYHSIQGSSNSISKPQTKLESIFYCLHIWKRTKCLLRSTFLFSCNLKGITLENVSKIKSVITLSFASKVLWESLTIKNCVQLENIIVDIGDNSVGGGDVFPNLKEVNVENCDKMEYIVGHIKASDDHQNHNEVTHIHLPALESLKLCSLPRLIGMRTKSNRTTFPPSMVLELIDCYMTDIKSFGDSTTIKESSGNMEHILNLKSLVVNNNKVQIFDLNEVNEQQMNLDLESVQLHMTDLFVGPKNSFVLTNLTRLKIVRCENLNFVLHTSILRCLPELINLRIEDCKKLKHIIEDDLEHKSTNTFFPKLEGLVIVNCHKLKCVFPISGCKTLPKLKILIIREANELKEIFVSESDQKVEIQNLKIVVFDNLPSLCQTQGIQFQAVNNRRVNNCHKLSLTSASTSNHIADICSIDDELYGELMLLWKPLKQVSIRHDTCNKNPSSEITEESAVGDETEAASGPMLTYSQENGDLGDYEETTQTTNQESKGRDNGNENPSVETTKDFDDGIKVQEPSGHERSSSQGIETIVEDGTTSTNSKTMTSSTHSELEVMDEESMDEQCLMKPQYSVGEIDTTIKPSQVVKEVGDGKICTPSFSIVNTEPPPAKDVDIGDSQKTIEDPLLEFEKLLFGQVSISSIRILLQELKSLMDSSSDLDHLISNQESKSKLISLFNQLNKHQGLLPSHVKEFIEKVQTFFNDNIIKYATFQEVFKKHNQLLDSKTDLMNKLSSAYSTQTYIDNEISTANARIDELSLQINEHSRKLEDIENQIEDLKLAVNRCNVQKNKLKAECIEWAQQSKVLNSTLASSEVDVREAERARNLATEGFANLKSWFPTF